MAERLLFEDLDLEIGPGEALQVTGPNGSGKSSLIRLAAGLLRAERGHVQSSAVALADDNLALDPELALRRALRFWGASTDVAMTSLDIDHLADVPVRLLSSGQAKRATLARVALSDAPLWLLDEPLNALDFIRCGAARRDDRAAPCAGRRGPCCFASTTVGRMAHIELGA